MPFFFLLIRVNMLIIYQKFHVSGTKFKLRVKKIGDYLIERQACDAQMIHAAIEQQTTLKNEGIYKPIGQGVRFLKRLLCFITTRSVAK